MNLSAFSQRRFVSMMFFKAAQKSRKTGGKASRKGVEGQMLVSFFKNQNISSVLERHLLPWFTAEEWPQLQHRIC